MSRVSDEDLERLAKVSGETPAARGVDFSRLIGEGESEEFYRGMVGGLLVAYNLLRASGPEGKGAEVLISLAAASASRLCLKAKGAEEVEFPDVIGDL